MDQILQRVPGYICFIDDICITGDNNEDHLSNLRILLSKLKAHGIRVRKEKCEFIRDSVEPLEFRISNEDPADARLPLKALGIESNSEDRIVNIHRLDALPVTITDMRMATNRDPVLSRVIIHMCSGWPADCSLSEDRKIVKRRCSELTEEDHCLMWGIKLVIPLPLRSLF